MNVVSAMYKKLLKPIKRRIVFRVKIEYNEYKICFYYVLMKR